MEYFAARFSVERINWLKCIGKKYKIYLLSNTNKIHYDSFIKLFDEQIGDGDFNKYFIKTYYSYEINLRKPAKECFEYVLKKENLKAAGYTKWDGLFLRPKGYEHVPAATYKTAIRKEITQLGYQIIVNIGDQKSDLVGGYADKGFKLPNPYYFIP